MWPDFMSGYFCAMERDPMTRPIQCRVVPLWTYPADETVGSSVFLTPCFSGSASVMYTRLHICKEYCTLLTLFVASNFRWSLHVRVFFARM